MFKPKVNHTTNENKSQIVQKKNLVKENCKISNLLRNYDVKLIGNYKNQTSIKNDNKKLYENLFKDLLENSNAHQDKLDHFLHSPLSELQIIKNFPDPISTNDNFIRIKRNRRKLSNNTNF